MKEQTQPTQPFFVRLLESQQEELEVKTDVTAGKPPYVTMKWPSDNDEGGPTF